MMRWLLRLLQDQVLLLVILCVIGFFIPWDEVLVYGEEVLDWSRAKVDKHPVRIALLYVVSFIVLTAASVPGPTALLLAVLGGWLFGWWAIPLSSLCSSTGASLAFLSSRYWMQDASLFRYFPKLQQFNEKPGWLMLLSLRMNPLIPYFLENLYFGRTQMPLWQFWLVTLVGMLPLTTLYVTTGAELARVESYHGLINWRVVSCFVAMSLVPLVAYVVQRRREGKVC